MHKITKVLGIIAILVLLTGVAQAGGGAPPRDSDGDGYSDIDEMLAGTDQNNPNIYQRYPRTITDSAGRNVTIYKPITKIITLTSDGAECVRTLGAVDNIVGVTEMINKDGREYFPELEDKPSVGTWKEFDYDEIANLAMNSTDGVVPGALVISYVSKVPEVEEKLSSFEHIAVVGLDFYKEETLGVEIVKLGYLLEREDEAQDFIDWRQEKIDKVKGAVDGLERPKVYIEKGSSTGTGEFGTYGKGSAFDMLCEIAGGENVASHIETTYPKVDWEWVIEQNPDIIIKSEPQTFLGLTSNAEELREEIMNRPSSGNISSIKNGRVYVHAHKITYGLESVVGLTYWAKIFHPDTSLDPEAVYREYLEEYQGLKYPEDKMVVRPEVEQTPSPTPTAAPTVTPTPTATPPAVSPISPKYLYIIPIALFIILLPFIFYIRRKRKKSTKPPAEPPKPETEPVKEEPIIKKETPPPISESITIERAIYDPCKRDFIEGRLPRMKEWINRYDPGAYWFATSIQNNTDKTIEEWGVDLETSSALNINEAKIEGIEIEIPSESHLGLFKISVPKEYGIVIPKGGAQRIYFKLRAEKPKTTYEISGVFKSAITGDVPIRAKEFKYLCDTGVSPEAVKAELKKTFSEKDAARLALSFKTVQQIDRMCDKEAKTEEYLDKLSSLQGYTEGFSENFTNQLDDFSRFMKQEQLEYLDDAYKGKVRRFCTNLVDVWINEFLRG